MTANMTPEERAQWRNDAEDDMRGMITTGGLRSCQQIIALLDALDEAEERTREVEEERDWHHARADVLAAKEAGRVALRGGKPGDYWAEWHRTHCAAAQGATQERERADAAEAKAARFAQQLANIGTAQHDARLAVERVKALADSWEQWAGGDPVDPLTERAAEVRAAMKGDQQ